MRTYNIFKTAALATALCLTACKTKTVVTDEPAKANPEQLEQKEYINKVNETANTAKFLTSKMKFTVEVGAQKLSLTGNLKMKRDDVIRLQLMAFGFVEAARIEFTENYVLIMDRINKQYIKAPYAHIDFLRNSGLNFYSLQALFWNELFQPGAQRLTSETLSKFETTEAGNDIVITLAKDKMSYNWLTDNTSGTIKMANILYKDRLNGNSQLNWDYQKFQPFSSKKFPTVQNVTLTMPKKEVKVFMTMNYLGDDNDWETRTKVSDKYREVTIDNILQRFMAL